MSIKTHGGDSNHPAFPHGSTLGYKLKCRCEPCVQARREYSRKWAADRRKTDPEYRERQVAITKAWRSRTPKSDETKAIERERLRNWRKTPKGLAARRDDESRRRAQMRGNGIEDLPLVRLIYERCPEGYHVDHIIPIKHGGKHAPENLQYLRADVNLRKSSSLSFDIPEDATIDWRSVLYSEPSTTIP